MCATGVVVRDPFHQAEHPSPLLVQANGAFSEYIKSPSALLWRVPEATGWEDAASMGGIGLSTAVYVVNYKLGLPRWNSPSKEPVPFLIWSGATSGALYNLQPDVCSQWLTDTL